jgi:hypothetical protein
MKSSGTLAALLESFFTQRLMNQRQASPHTISSYRNTFWPAFTVRPATAAQGSSQAGV